MNTHENKTTENKATSGLDSDMPEVGMAEHHVQSQAAEEQVARYAADLLNDHAQHLTAVTARRLSVARGLAVSQLARQQTQTISHSGNVLLWFGNNVGQYFGHHRVMSTAVIVGALILAFFAAQQFGINNNLENSDAFLLASDLPPEAYADKGFDAWLDSK